MRIFILGDDKDMYFLLIILLFILFSMWCSLRVSSIVDNNLNEKENRE